MRRMRSLNFPRISTSKALEAEDQAMRSPYQFFPGHSRDSSAASSVSSPVTSTSSNAGHNRWPGSNSSLDTTPESPAVVAKLPLHDLVEDPEEPDELSLHGIPSTTDEPFCICDTTNCEHRKTLERSSGVVSPAGSEWVHGDDQFNLGVGPSFKRRKSGDGAVTGTVRKHSRFPSITKRWTDRKATISLSSPAVHSAPPSRSSSLQTPSVRRSLASHLGPSEPLTPPATPARSGTTSITRTKPPPEPLDIKAADLAEDAIDREAQNATPLLPPMMHSLRRRDDEEELQSPLQSPSVAPMSSQASATNTPVSPPPSLGVQTPELSTKPSIASITIGHHHGFHHSQDIPAMSISDESDLWSAKLGHNNFIIYPEPYRPEICDHRSCSTLLHDWETARSKYMRHASQIAEISGSTSRVYKLTEQKWAGIDALWRSNLEEANAEAVACGETPAFQSLAETRPLTKIPTLNDPQQPAKFPEINEDDIVGPMVQYAKAAAKPAKKPILLRIFTSPASLLSGRRRPSV